MAGGAGQRRIARPLYLINTGRRMLTYVIRLRVIFLLIEGSYELWL